MQLASRRRCRRTRCSPAPSALSLLVEEPVISTRLPASDTSAELMRTSKATMVIQCDDNGIVGFYQPGPIIDVDLAEAGEAATNLYCDRVQDTAGMNTLSQTQSLAVARHTEHRDRLRPMRGVQCHPPYAGPACGRYGRMPAQVADRGQHPGCRDHAGCRLSWPGPNRPTSNGMDARRLRCSRPS